MKTKVRRLYNIAKKSIAKLVPSHESVPEDVAPDSNRVYSDAIDVRGVVYQEQQAIGAKNLEVKFARVAEGGPFEWPNIVALNQAAASFIGDAKDIVSVGSGTGTFEWYASEDKSIHFTASEFDRECVEWCKENRQRENIVYNSQTMQELLQDHGKYDLAVSIEVIEHVQDYKTFLEEFSQLADRAIITTPNKDRDIPSALAPTPAYYQHVREWDAGELYWILKMFYSRVELYAMPDVYVPEVEQVGLLTSMTPLIAVCTK